MADTENLSELERPKKGKGRLFGLLIVLAGLLSLGSLIWATYSLLDFFQIGGIDPANFKFKDLNPIGLSAASTADIAWSITMIAEYRGSRIMMRLRKEREPINLLPWIGWAEVLFVATMLFMHGKQMGNGAAAFAAFLPVMTRFSWILVFNDMKDPSELTEEQKLRIAEMARQAKMTLAETEASAEKHQADLEAQRRRNEAALENTRAEIERQKLEALAKFEMKEAHLRGENDLKTLERRLNVELQAATLRGQQDIQLMRLDAENELSLRAPIPYIQGRVIPSGRPAISAGEDVNEELLGEYGDISLAGQGLSDSQMKQARLALSYYTVNANRGGSVKKADFCTANGLRPPRLSEATTAFPEEWFQMRGLATWASSQN